MSYSTKNFLLSRDFGSGISYMRGMSLCLRKLLKIGDSGHTSSGASLLGIDVDSSHLRMETKPLKFLIPLTKEKILPHMI